LALRRAAAAAARKGGYVDVFFAFGAAAD